METLLDQPVRLAISLSDVEEAARRLADVVVHTPLLEIESPQGGRLLIKCEPFQIGGSFKFRGAYNRLAALSAEERSRGVVAASTGNHAQGIGHAAKRLGMKALIVMPEDAPKIKIENTRNLGCELVFYDREKDDRDAIGARLAKERGTVFVPPYDDPFVIAGQGTIGLELLEQAGTTLDAVLVSCGGGGLSGGIATVMSAKSPTTQMVIVEPVGYDDTVRSLEIRRRIAIEAGAFSICDAISTKMPGELTFPIHLAAGTKGFSVSDDDVRVAMRYAFSTLKVVVEAGGAVALAAVLSGRYPVPKGKTAAVILSGGNVDPDFFAEVLTGL